MASAVSIRSLAQNRRARSIWCLARPTICRPRLAGVTRWTPNTAATSTPRVLARDNRNEPAQTEITHAVASLRRMTDTSQSVVPGGSLPSPCRRARAIVRLAETGGPELGIRVF